jgi:hypothetical protein
MGLRPAPPPRSSSFGEARRGVKDAKATGTGAPFRAWPYSRGERHPFVHMAIAQTRLVICDQPSRRKAVGAQTSAPLISRSPV